MFNLGTCPECHLNLEGGKHDEYCCTENDACAVKEEVEEEV